MLQFSNGKLDDVPRLQHSVEVILKGVPKSNDNVFLNSLLLGHLTSAHKV